VSLKGSQGLPFFVGEQLARVGQAEWG